MKMSDWKWKDPLGLLSKTAFAFFPYLPSRMSFLSLSAPHPLQLYMPTASSTLWPQRQQS